MKNNAGRFLTVALLCFVVLFGCDDSETIDRSHEDKNFKAISIEPSEISISYGSSQRLVPIGMYEGGSSGKISGEIGWQSSNTSIVDVSNDGIVTAKGVGATEVRASYNGMDATCVVTVTSTSYTLENNRNKVLLGPVADSIINVYKLNDRYVPIETTNTDEFGHFDLVLDDIPDEELLLIVTSGGQDIDPNDDGMIEGPPAPNNGFIHALAKAENVRSGKLNISLISEIAWQYTINLIEDAHPEDLKRFRLKDIADVLFTASNNSIENLTRFNPLLDDDRQKLTFKYELLLGQDGLADAIREGADDVIIRERIQQVLGNILSFNPSVDLRYQYVKLTLAPFGDGRIEASSGGLFYDSSNPDSNMLSAFYPIGETIILTATPAEGREVVSWRGSDFISEDMRQCTVIMTEDKMVLPTFVIEEPVISEKAVDLSKTMATVDGTTYTLSALKDDTETISKMQSLLPGDYIVSSQPPYFIREVVSIAPGDDESTFVIETDGVDIEKLIVQGTGFIERELTHDDLVDENNAEPRSRSVFQPALPIKSGAVKLLPPEENENHKFIFSFSEGRERSDVSVPKTRKADAKIGVDAGVVFTTDDGAEISLSGELAVEMKLDFGWEFEDSKLDEIRCIPEVTTTENLSLNISGNAFEKTAGKKLGTINLGNQVFLIGIVPVLISEQIDIIAHFSSTLDAEAGIGIEAKQSFEIGFNWSQGQSIEPVKNINVKKAEADAMASATLDSKAYLSVEPKLLIYKLIGPEFGINGGFNLVTKGTIGATSEGAAMSELTAELLFFLYANMRIDIIESDAKLIQSLKDVLSFTNINLYHSEDNPKEFPIKDWIIQSGTIGEIRPKLLVEGESHNYAFEYDEDYTIPSVVSSYKLTNTSDETLDWRIRVDGSLADYLIVSPDDSGSIEPGGTVNIDIQRNNIPNIGDWSASIRIINETHSDLLPYRSGTTKRSLSYEISDVYYSPEIISVTVIGNDFHITWVKPTDYEMKHIDHYNIWAIDDTGDKTNLKGTVYDPAQTSFSNKREISDGSLIMVEAYGRKMGSFFSEPVVIDWIPDVSGTWGYDETNYLLWNDETIRPPEYPVDGMRIRLTDTHYIEQNGYNVTGKQFVEYDHFGFCGWENWSVEWAFTGTITDDNRLELNAELISLDGDVRKCFYETNGPLTMGPLTASEGAYSLGIAEDEDGNRYLEDDGYCSLTDMKGDCLFFVEQYRAQ